MREFLAKISDIISPGDLTAGTGEIALCSLTGKFSSAPHGFGLFPGAFFGGFFVGGAKFHRAEDAFALKLFLENLEGLVNVVISDDDVHY